MFILMIITGIVAEESQGHEIVLVTEPKFTAELANEYNKLFAGNLVEKDGCFVISRQKYLEYSQPQLVGRVAREISEMLTQAESHVEAAKLSAQREREGNLAHIAKVFGVPLVERPQPPMFAQLL